MGEVVGYVQQNASAGHYTIVQPRNRWAVGTYATVPAAMKALEGMTGRRYRWTRDDLGAVERWRANDAGWWPGDYGAALQLLFAGSGQQPAVDGGNVSSWRAQSASQAAAAYQSLTQVTAGKQPQYLARGASSPALVFAESASGALLYGSFATLEVPFTIGISAKYQAPVGAPYADYRAMSSDLFLMYVAGSGPSAGKWMARVVPTQVTGTIAASGGVDAVVARVTAAGTTLYVNGVESVSSALTPVGAIGAISIGADADTPHPWIGQYYGLVVVSRDSSLQEVRNLTGWLQRLGS